MEFVDEMPSVTQERVQAWKIGPDPILKNRVIDDVIHFLSQRFTLGPSTLFKYRLCLDEAITNSITHGCRGTNEPHVEIEFFFGDNEWAMQIRDQGPGFNPTTIPDPSDPGNEMREQGRGILILERYTDRLVFSEDGRCQTLWMKTNDLS